MLNEEAKCRGQLFFINFGILHSFPGHINSESKSKLDRVQHIKHFKYQSFFEISKSNTLKHDTILIQWREIGDYQ